MRVVPAVDSVGKELDSQTVEIIGRNRLIHDLLLAQLEIALPLRDRGIDLIAYKDQGEERNPNESCIGADIFDHEKIREVSKPNSCLCLVRAFAARRGHVCADAR